MSTPDTDNPQYRKFQQQAAEGHTRIPVVREVFSDLDTPLSVYLKLADGPHTYLFESVEGGERFGRYSIIGLPATRVYAFAGHTLYVTEHGELVEAREVADPFAEVERLRTQYSVPKIDGLPGFTGGLVGWFGFECIQYIEPRLAAPGPDGEPKPDELGTPDILLMLSEEVAVFDNLKGRLYLIVHADPAEPQAWARANRRLDQLVHRLRSSGTTYPETLDPAGLDEADFVSGFTREGFINAVEKSKEYIRGGDIFQVVLSQRLSVPFKARPVDVYRALRALNPSPYMYFLDVGEMQVVGSSPEILARLQYDAAGQGTVTVRPIAGTRPRGATPAEDDALEAELLADPKERAEHLMLIDLGRNDVGRISQPGTVEVGEQFVIERYSHVMHIVSEVTGRLKPGLSYADVLRATFPAGTVSGAPKIRALEVIRELEPIKRNVYAGSIGYLGWHGDADTAIAIRTAVIQDGRLHVQAGAGIVHDSDPVKEWEETMSKGRALFRAVAEAARGL
ncbi:anthranilate synthase component I [Lysobacter concretionis Ko07 = DSM 16239]|uniref:Anthranilate synthase component 1 n=1 Tax=Lysobacter concretionis Ko07 = DSM 16239 TaxID=1122185 RepID=A0A0A0ES34_9GAMM|nr:MULTISPECIES: anthranilate synthase component I [Lysobacter]KGM52923.1 anthranilate synthase component I [Lysobacter concretionis Ko07 = DSM 16239]QOD91362.1 anthranilate synthase component I [Lysobacter sp. CW239]